MDEIGNLSRFAERPVQNNITKKYPIHAHLEERLGASEKPARFQEFFYKILRHGTFRIQYICFCGFGAETSKYGKIIRISN